MVKVKCLAEADGSELPAAGGAAGVADPAGLAADMAAAAATADGAGEGLAADAAPEELATAGEAKLLVGEAGGVVKVESGADVPEATTAALSQDDAPPTKRVKLEPT